MSKIVQANEPSYKEDYLCYEPSTNNKQLQYMATTVHLEDQSLTFAEP